MMKKPPAMNCTTFGPILRIQKFGGRSHSCKDRDRLIRKLENWQEETGDALKDRAAARVVRFDHDAGTSAKVLDYSFMAKRK